MSDNITPDPTPIQPKSPLYPPPIQKLSPSSVHLISIIHNFSDRLDRSSHSNESLYKIFDHLQLIQDMVLSNYLTSDQSDELSVFLEETQMGFFDNTVKIHQVHDELDFIINQLSSDNPKIRTLTILHDLYDMLCVHPIHHLPILSKKEFYQMTTPIKQTLSKESLSTFLATSIARQLEHIRDDFIHNPNEQIQIVMYRIEQLAKEVQNY